MIVLLIERTEDLCLLRPVGSICGGVLGGEGEASPPSPSPVVRGEGSERAPPVCKWGVLRASNREGNCLWVKYEEAVSPVCVRRGRVSSSDLIFTLTCPNQTKSDLPIARK